MSQKAAPEGFHLLLYLAFGGQSRSISSLQKPLDFSQGMCYIYTTIFKVMFALSLLERSIALRKRIWPFPPLTRGAKSSWQPILATNRPDEQLMDLIDTFLHPGSKGKEQSSVFGPESLQYKLW